MTDHITTSATGRALRGTDDERESTPKPRERASNQKQAHKWGANGCQPTAFIAACERAADQSKGSALPLNKSPGWCREDWND